MRKNDEECFLAEYLINNKDKLEDSLGIRIKELNLVQKKRNKKIEINGNGEEEKRDGELKLLERIFLEKRGMKVYNPKF